MRGTTCVPARVAWAGGDRVGLEFDHMIDEHEVLVQLGSRQRPPRQPQSYPPARPRRGMAADERKIAQAWGVAVGLNIPESEG